MSILSRISVFYVGLPPEVISFELSLSGSKTKPANEVTFQEFQAEIITCKKS